MKLFDLTETAIAGVCVVQRKRIGDQRGFLERLYCETEWGQQRLPGFRQINRTLTDKAGTVRGMHFQHPPAAEVKLVTCLRGRVFDVAVDVRQGSPTYGHWFGTLLEGSGDTSLLIPEGCAHGFQTLEADCEMLYLHSSDYSPEHEGGVNAATLGIEWPHGITLRSDRDSQLPDLDEIQGVVI